MCASRRASPRRRWGWAGGGRRAARRSTRRAARPRVGQPRAARRRLTWRQGQRRAYHRRSRGRGRLRPARPPLTRRHQQPHKTVLAPAPVVRPSVFGRVQRRARREAQHGTPVDGPLLLVAVTGVPVGRRRSREWRGATPGRVSRVQQIAASSSVRRARCSLEWRFLGTLALHLSFDATKSIAHEHGPTQRRVRRLTKSRQLHCTQVHHLDPPFAVAATRGTAARRAAVAAGARRSAAQLQVGLAVLGTDGVVRAAPASAPSPATGSPLLLFAPPAISAASASGHGLESGYRIFPASDFTAALARGAGAPLGAAPAARALQSNKIYHLIVCFRDHNTDHLAD